MYRSSRSYGFTLIELLVVIAIIAILAAILFPVFAAAREKARQATCLSNQKQIALAFLGYIQDYDETYPMAEYGTGLTQNYWPMMVDPYIKGGLNDTANSGGLSKNQPKSVYVCPDDGAPLSDNSGSLKTELSTRTLFSYQVNDYICPDDATGKTFQEPASDAKVDTPANLVLLSEGLGDNSYQMGRDDKSGGYSNSSSGGTKFHDACYMNARRRHSGGANFAFCDGHAKWFAAPSDHLSVYDATTYAGQDVDTIISWVHCSAGPTANPAGWFYPLTGTIPEGQASHYKYQGSGFPSDACP